MQRGNSRGSPTLEGEPGGWGDPPSPQECLAVCFFFFKKIEETKGKNKRQEKMYIFRLRVSPGVGGSTQLARSGTEWAVAKFLTFDVPKTNLKCSADSAPERPSAALFCLNQCNDRVHDRLVAVRPLGLTRLIRTDGGRDRAPKVRPSILVQSPSNESGSCDAFVTHQALF